MVSPVLRSLYWLPVKQQQQIDYKLATHVYKSLRGQARRMPAGRALRMPPSFAPLMPTFFLFREQTLDLATGVSRLRVREFGTVYPPYCGSLTLKWTLWTTFKGISVWWDRGALVTFWFQCAVYKSIYLLTYLLTDSGPDVLGYWREKEDIWPSWACMVHGSCPNQWQAVLLKESFLWLNELLMTAYHS